MDPRIQKILLVAVVIIIAVGYFFAERTYHKSQSYSGEITKKISKTKFGKWFKLNSSSSSNRKFYLVIRTEKGKEKKVKVPRFVYNKFKEGDHIVKIKGERYPKDKNDPSENIFQ